MAFTTFVAILWGAWSARADKEAGHKEHVIFTADKLAWKPNPNFPAGVQTAILAGDPAKGGALYAMRVKFPDGYQVPPHWHPVDENVTVLQGTLLIGVGDKFDATKTTAVPTGSFMVMPKEMRHFAQTKGETILQLNGIGPFEVHYVNPADDPRKAK
ncbi:MAG: cupin domain-containing protein [Gemmataceae bacterium]|nr:cupin domain-containing protein [Gemmataceae bacterium]